MLEPCLLKPCFHVAGKGPLARARPHPRHRGQDDRGAHRQLPAGPGHPRRQRRPRRGGPIIIIIIIIIIISSSSSSSS